MWSEIVITFVLRKQQAIEYKTQLAAKASISLNTYIYIYLGPCQGPDPLSVTHIKKKYKKSLTFLKNRKFSKTWQDPIYRQNLVYYYI